MDYQAGETSSQLVLDNRKLIVGFALLILICGSFFVIGFMEGKRQGIQHAGRQQPDPDAISPTNSADLPTAKATETQSDAKPDNAVKDQVDWYKDVNRKGEAPVRRLEPPPATHKGTEPAAGSTVDAAATARPGKAVSERPPATTDSGKVTYSVQVGAFRYRQEAETKAAVLKAKRYKYVIEPSGGPENLFLLKVGKYESRADAVAMQLRLKKDGFVTFIKSSK